MLSLFLKSLQIKSNFFYLINFLKLSIIILNVISSLSAEEKKANQSLRFQTENDAFLFKDSDRYYTGGGKLDYFTTNPNRFTNLIFYKWNSFFINSDKNSTGFHFLQESYTPTSILKSGVSYGDRPYSSRIGFGNSLTSINSDSLFFSKIELGQIGNVHQIQAASHKIIAAPKPLGWENEMPQFGTISLQFEKRKFWHRFIGGNLESNFGNVKTNLSASLIFRLGKIDKNPSMLFSNSAPVVSTGDSNTNWFFYFNPGFTAVVYDGTLQGNPLNKNTFQTTQRESILDESSNYLALRSNSPDQNFLQKKILEEILSDSGSNTSARFALYENYFIKNTNNPYGIGVNYILFNNIFNSSEETSKGFKYLLLSSVISDENKMSPEVKLLSYYSLLKPDDKAMPAEVKIVSYKILSETIVDPNSRNLFLSYLYESYFQNRGKTYTANPERIIGFFKIGFNFFSKSNYFLGLAYNFQTIDFQATKGLPQKHEWAGFQLGKNF